MTIYHSLDNYSVCNLQRVTLHTFCCRPQKIFLWHILTKKCITIIRHSTTLSEEQYTAIFVPIINMLFQF